MFTVAPPAHHDTDAGVRCCGAVRKAGVGVAAGRQARGISCYLNRVGVQVLSFAEGTIHSPDGPGPGARIDEVDLARYRVA
jgi:hypothetical protein